MELVKLKDEISVYFSQSELKELCFNLGIDFEDLPGEGKKDKAIKSFERYLQLRPDAGDAAAIRKRIEQLSQ